jgi:muramoyltetrapeptide carboxypeptidase LdcA involved in peptidoglycan recycling
METIYPKHLKIGDEIRVIAPSSSLGIISKDVQSIADERFNELGLRLTFGKHTSELDDFSSSSVESRLEDLHTAYADTSVAVVLCVIGGFNSNQLLSFIDWKLIQDNPKPLIGYSDITVLLNAIYTKTGMVGYLGPAYSTFGQKKYFDYTLENFRKCLLHDEPFFLESSPEWTDDLWFIDQEDRKPIRNDGPMVVNQGAVEGILIGGNISSLALLFGTEYMPDLSDKILCLEDDEDTNYKQFDRLFESLLQQPGADSIKGILIGRFQRRSEITNEQIRRMIAIRSQLKNIPVIANLDFGHTSPLATLPIGGTVSIDTKREFVLKIEKF